METNRIENIILPTELPLLFMIPADKNLAGAEIELVEIQNREYKLKKILKKIKKEYDYIIIDCPPSLGLLTIKWFNCCRFIIGSNTMRIFCIEGVTELFDTFARLRRGLNPQLAIEGLLLTMYDERTNLSAAVAQDLRDFYGTQVLKTVIPRNVRFGGSSELWKTNNFI